MTSYSELHMKPNPETFPKYKVYTGKIPEDAPEAVKQILRNTEIRMAPHLHPNPPSAYAMMHCRLEMARKIQALGYNPLDYGIDLEKLNKTLSVTNAYNLYSMRYNSPEGICIIAATEPQKEVVSKTREWVKRIANFYRKHPVK